jgi:copper chaperone CopZ
MRYQLLATCYRLLFCLYHRSMTQLEALYRYDGHPTKTAMFALGNLREVYGIRRIKVDEDLKTIRVEYDATRLASPTIVQLLRQTGLPIVEELSLIPAAAVVPVVADPSK